MSAESSSTKVRRPGSRARDSAVSGEASLLARRSDGRQVRRVLPVQLLTLADGSGERSVRLHPKRCLRGRDRAIELTRRGVRGSKNVQRARVLSSGEIGGLLGKPDRLTRVPEGGVRRRREKPREARHCGYPVGLELNGLAKLTGGFREIAARAKHAAHVVVSLGVRRVEAERFTKVLQRVVGIPAP
jgi:hypothetical protein